LSDDRFKELLAKLATAGWCDYEARQLKPVKIIENIEIYRDAEKGAGKAEKKLADYGQPPLSYTLAKAPEGVTVRSDGTVEVAADKVHRGEHTIRVMVKDALEQSDEKDVTVNVYDPLRLPNSVNVCRKNCSKTAKAQLVPVGGKPGYTWYLVKGLPGGPVILLSKNGELTIPGNNVDAGKHTIKVTVTDANKKSVTGEVELSVIDFEAK
jgi:hypothetical protein